MIRHPFEHFELDAIFSVCFGGKDEPVSEIE